MNLLYLKYAVEVAACGSINKAAEKLYIGQPNLSRAIKELESSLGVTIIGRSSKGMEITPDGEIFLGYAKSILKQGRRGRGTVQERAVRSALLARGSGGKLYRRGVRVFRRAYEAGRGGEDTLPRVR